MNDKNLFQEGILISRDVDEIIEKIVEYILRDYIFSWASKCIPNDESFRESLSIKIKNELWVVLRNLINRMREIDTVTLFSETLPRILQKHFEKFNLALAHQIDENQHIVRFVVARHLGNAEAELEFIRKLSEYLLRILFPNNYALSDELVYLIREILAKHVIFNAIDYICDPYFINHQATVYGSVVGPVASSLESSFGSINNATQAVPSTNTQGFPIDDEEEPKEDISDSIYDLVCEIFALKRAHIRRAIITLFQVAFGKTINRQLKDSILQLSSEKFIHDQLVKFMNSFWPDGVLAENNPPVSENDRKLTYLLAKQYLITSIPDVFLNLIGQQNARKGFLKVFEALQSKKANKQLFYDILEAVIIELSPELRAR